MTSANGLIVEKGVNFKVDDTLCFYACILCIDVERTLEIDDLLRALIFLCDLYTIILKLNSAKNEGLSLNCGNLKDAHAF